MNPLAEAPMRLLAPLFLLATACGEAPFEPKPDHEAAKTVAGRLCSLFAREVIPCDWKDNVAKTEGHEITVSATLQNEISIGSSSTLDLRFEFAIDGQQQPALNADMVGSAMSRKEAHSKASDDWARIYGAAVVDRVLNTGRIGVLQALQDDQDPPAAFVTGEWVAYPGWAELRGKRTEARSIDTVKLLASVQPKIDAWKKEPGAIHAMHIQLNLADGHGVDKECTLDGIKDDSVCELALGYDWPKGNYLIKQYFVFAPGPLPEGVETRVR